MDIEAARADLARTMNAAGADGGPRAAHRLLIAHGIEALSLKPSTGLSLDEIVRIAAEAPPSEARRMFAVLLVYATGIPGLPLLRGETGRLIQRFLENALLNPLRRACYPFEGTPYDKRQALAGLHATIDRHLRPLEPSIPRWIHGLGGPDQD